MAATGGKNRADVRIWGDDADAVYTAPKGVIFPAIPVAPATAAEPTAPTADFFHLGWLGEDGIDLAQDQTINTFNAHQGGAQIRSKKSAVSRSFSFQALQANAVTMGLYFPGSTLTTSNGVSQFRVPSGARSDERAWMIELWDDDLWLRYLIDVGEVGETGSLSHTNSGIQLFEYTVNVLSDFSVQSNSPAWAAAVA